MSMKSILTDLVDVIGGFISKHRDVVIVVGVVALVMGGTAAYAWDHARPARQRDYWYVPTKQPVPQPLHEAGRLSLKIQRHDARWKAEMDDLTKLIEGQKPGELDLSREIATTDAFRAYVAKLLRAGNRP